jgi:integrase
MANRSRGEGSLYQLPSGTWRGQVTIEGRRLSYTARTKNEVVTWIRSTTDQVEKGLTWSAAKTTMEKFIATWLEIKKTRLRLATQEQYSRIVRLYINPYLGSLVMMDLNAARLQAFYGRLQEQGIGARTVQLVHVVLHGCLEHAQRLGLISQNWAELVEAPRPEKREMRIWDESQVSQFLAFAPDPAFYRLAFATGMRRGELLGLQWKDLDWRTDVITVRRQVFEPEGGGWRFQEPKSRAGMRSIRLGPELMEVLRSQFNQVIPSARRLAGDIWQEEDLIFPSSVGTPRNGYDVTKRFHQLAEAAGLPAIRFHDIRHTSASILLMHQVPPVRVAAILGQGLAVLLSTYAHFIPDDSDQAALLMDDITATSTLHTIYPRNHPFEKKNATVIDTGLGEGKKKPGDHHRSGR